MSGKKVEGIESWEISERELKKGIRVVSDATSHGTFVCDVNGDKINGVVGLNISIDLGSVRTVVSLYLNNHMRHPVDIADVPILAMSIK